MLSYELKSGRKPRFRSVSQIAMESTINALGNILLNAVPTFLLFILLHFYLKSTFFKPMEKVLKQRHEATAGERKRAEEALAKAEAKAREYEESLKAVRNEIYKDQEEVRRKWQKEQDEQIAAANAQSKALISAAKADIESEVVIARQSLEAESRVLADKIANSVLAGGTL